MYGDDIRLFQGQVLRHVRDVILVGRFQGEMLRYAFDYHFKWLCQMVREGYVFPDRIALMELDPHDAYLNGIISPDLFYDEEKRFRGLVGTRDYLLDFGNDTLTSCEDTLNGKVAIYNENHSHAYEEYSYYDGLTLREAFDRVPLYLIRKIRERKILVTEEILTGMDSSSEYYEKLEEEVQSQVYDRKADELYRQEQREWEAEREEQRWLLNEGYRSAFDGDADSEWNID